MGTNFGEKFTVMLPALNSKKNEFHLYGYTTVTIEDIWVYCLRKKWRDQNVELMNNHQVINDILKILPAAFMTYTQIEAQRNSDWFSDLNADDLQRLLGPQKKSENK